MFIKPAPDALCLKVVMKLYGKWSVGIAEAYEACSELDRLAQKRGQLLDKVFRNTAASQKYLRDIPSRIENGAYGNVRWSDMFHRFKILHTA
jgi:hypothetical protein